MELREQFAWFRQGILIIARQHGAPVRWPLMRAFVTGHFRMFSQRKRPAPGRTQFLDFDVAYFSEEAYLILLHEMFVEPQYAIPLSSKKPFIVDGGANIGMSVLLWKHAYPEARVVAFEPDPDTFEMLQRNASANGLSDVQLINAALSDKDGELSLSYDARTPGNLGMTMSEGSPLPNRRNVQAVALSNYITENVDLLKLDVEGAEHEVLADLAETGKLKLIDQMVMEYHHHLTPTDDRLGQLLSILESNGFGYDVLGARHTGFRRGNPNPFFIYAYRAKS